MSFTKNQLLSIGLLCAVVIGACLLWLYSSHAEMSDRNQAAASTAAVMQVATSSEMLATSTISSVVATSSSAAAVTIPAVAQPSVPSTKATSQPPITFEVVTTPAAQQKGLSGRAVVPDNYAMLFVFPTPSYPGFWMIDMLVPLDMIWLNANGVIVSINANVSPATYPNVFYPPSPVKYVLETKAGFAAERGWKVGTKVALPAPY